MPVEQSNPYEIGVVTGVSGEAYAQTASGTRILEPGSPIFQGEELVTGGNGNVEVRFVDDTLISQGANSRIALDDYVYDPDGGNPVFLVILPKEPSVQLQVKLPNKPGPLQARLTAGNNRYPRYHHS